MSKRARKTTVPALLTDAELLQALNRKQSDELFREIVSRHGKTVMASCRQVLSDPADLEDAFQATFVVLFRKVGSVHGETLSAWLYAVAHRVAVRTLTDRQKRIVKENRAAKQQPHATVAIESSMRAFPLTPIPSRQMPEREIPHNEISWRESVQILHEELDRLPEGCRQVLILCYLCGHSREEAALCLNWSVGAVKGMLERGRKMLASRLARRGIAWSVGLLAIVTGSSARAMTVTATLIEMTVQAAKQQLANGLTGWIPGGLVMARMAVHGLVSIAVAVGLVVWFAPSPAQSGGNNRTEIEEIAALHQKTIDSFKTIHLKMEVGGRKDEIYQEELWKDGENHRWTTTDFIRPGGKQETLVKDGKKSNWAQAQFEGAILPLYSGSINPSSKETMIDPLGHCLFSCLDQATMESLSIPFGQLLKDQGATCECNTVTESGREYAVVKWANKYYSREIWFSKHHNYLVSKLIQNTKWRDHSEKNRGLKEVKPFKNSTINKPAELNPTVIFSVEAFTEFSPGVYFPTRMATHVENGPETNPEHVTTVQVRSIEINRSIAPSSFEFQFPPEMLIWDRVEKKVWRTDANGSLGVEARDENGKLIPFTYHPTPLAPILTGFLVLCGLLFIAIKRFCFTRLPALA